MTEKEIDHDKILTQLSQIQSDLKKIHNKKSIFLKWKFWLILLILFFIFIFISSSFKQPDLYSPNFPHIASIQLDGEITKPKFLEKYSATQLLESMFENNQSVAILLDLDSPGGDAYTAFTIAEKIQKLKKRHPNKKVYALVRQMCTSGCYLIASVADYLIAHQSSFVGSIGVLLGSGIRVNRLLEQYQIDYDPIKSGKHKDMLNPLAPKNEYAQKQLQSQADDIHRLFINFVKQNRPEIQSDHPDLFSGLVWTGKQSMDLGLIDALGGEDLVLTQIEPSTKNLNFYYYEHKKEFFDQFSNVGWHQLQKDIQWIKSFFHQTENSLKVR